MKLLYGTGNAAKLEAMRRSLAGFGFEILGLGDMEKKAPSVPETGNTPLENARQKALAYYGFYGMPVFSCDSGLYFEGLPEELQPGIHVRTIGGKYLTDEEMLEYYSGLAKKYGDLRARYRNGVCLVLDGEHIHEVMDETTESRAFLLTSVPHSGIRHRGFPLDSISVDIGTGKYFYDLEEGQIDRFAVEKGILRFFQSLKL